MTARATADPPASVPGPARHPAAFYYLLFVCSGAAGLICESVWAQYLRLLLGHAALAQVLVLSLYMGGLAWGPSWPRAIPCACRTCWRPTRWWRAPSACWA
jgi:hypothetical protein